MTLTQFMRKKSYILIFIIGGIYTIFFLWNSVPAFDDLCLGRGFDDLFRKKGYWKSLGILLSGMDLPTQYRTYAFSRILQFNLWIVSNGHSVLLSLFIALSQCGTAFVLYLLLTTRKISESLSIAITLVWLLSPFSVNWSFHHYSYIIFPYQVTLFTCFIVPYVITSRCGYFFTGLLGVCCALTGEMHLPVSIAALFFFLFRSKKKSKRLFACVIGSMCFTLFLHRWFWGVVVQASTKNQRFMVNFDLLPDVVLLRASTTIASIGKSLLCQLETVFLTGFWPGMLVGVLISTGYWYVVNTSTGFKNEVVQDLDNNLPIHEDVKLFWVLAISTALSFVVYIGLSVLSGQVYITMPRRYGFVSLSLLLLMVVTLCSIIFKAGKIQKWCLAIILGFVASTTGQLLGRTVPLARTQAASLVSQMKDAASANGKFSEKSKGLLFYVANAAPYQTGAADLATVGPAYGSFTNSEVLQSPFNVYWTAVYYCKNILGFRFAGIHTDRSKDGRIKFRKFKWESAEGPITESDAIVVANLGLDQVDPFGKNIQVFKDFEAFEPSFFGRTIVKEIFDNKSRLSYKDELIVDLGQTDHTIPVGLGMMRDKNFNTLISAIPVEWVENYGLISGERSVYSNESISEVLSYYRTNRNGIFSYGVTFRTPGKVEVYLDFWEQWGRKPGERVFEIEVTWDGLTWSSLGKIDLASINGEYPFSIVLTKKDPKVFQFRMKPIIGSKDVPIIQGLRIHKL